MLPICVQYPYRTCILDLYVSNILTGHVYFETFVRVVFGRSLSGVCLISLPDICSLYVFNILTEHVYSIFMCPISLPGMYYFETFVRVVFGRSLSGVCLISLPDICSLYVFNILTEHVYSILMCPISLPDMYYFETFVRVVFGRSLSGVCLISLLDICSLYVFNILTEHVYSILMCPISLPGMYISKPLLESSSVGLFPVYV